MSHLARIRKAEALCSQMAAQSAFRSVRVDDYLTDGRIDLMGYLKAVGIGYEWGGIPTVRQAIESDSFITGLIGPFGSAKSSGCVMKILRHALEQEPGPDGVRRTVWAVIRNTYPQLRDTAMRTVLEWLPESMGKLNRSSDHSFVITAIPGVHVEIMFRALDLPKHVANLLSLNLTGAWVNEARELPWAIMGPLQGRLGRFPPQSQGGPTWHGMIMDTNPPDTDSWWYDLFEVKAPQNAVLFRQPGGRAENAENLENLPDGYYDNMAESMSAGEIAVYVDGEYGYVADGRPIFPEYNDAMHSADVEYVPGLPIHRGWDFGLTPACVLSQILPSGRWQVLDEICADDMGIDRHSDDVLLHCSREYPNADWIDTGDPAGEQRAQTDERTCFDILQGKGIQIGPGEQSIQIRFESVRKPLRTMVDGEPGFAISRKAVRTRKGLAGKYQFRRLQVSGEKYAEVPEKNIWSHPVEALQYTATRIFGDMVRGVKSKRRIEQRRIAVA